MLCQYFDATAEINDDGFFNMDASPYDYLIVHIITPSATVTFNTTNDPGDVQGTTDGNEQSATNWIACQGTNLNTGTAATASGVASGIWRFNYIGRFFQLTFTPGTITKVVIKAVKIGM